MIEFDNAIYNLVTQIRNDRFTEVLKVITNLGGIVSLFFIALCTVLILFLFKKRKEGIAVALNLLLSTFTYVVLKSIIQRPRPPEVERLISETGFSFPSGHTTNNIAFYGFAIYLIWNQVKNKKLRNILCIMLGILPILIGFSRIYLRVHYPSDVLAGIVLGTACVVFFVKIVYPKIND